MPETKYLNVRIGDFEVEVKNFEELPVSINYALEDPENFQNKKSAQALGLEIPATLMNDKSANTFRNIDVQDLTTGQVFKGNQPCLIEANGHELLIGKAFLANATHTDKPQGYKFDLYGDNADWMLDLQEKTLFDFLSHISFDYTKSNIIDSWAFDGTDINLPYVFAPVRYRSPMGGNDKTTGAAIDTAMSWDYFKPSLSIYWILFKGFQSLGYKIESSFFNSNYFKRMVMPWTWGSLLDSEGGVLDIHKFLAKQPFRFFSYTISNSVANRESGFLNANVTNSKETPAFDNNNGYSYDALKKAMRWEYKAPFFGILEATFALTIDWNCLLKGSNSDAAVRVYWYVNGNYIKTDTIFEFSGGTNNSDITTVYLTTIIDPNAFLPGLGTVVEAKIYYNFYYDKSVFLGVSGDVDFDLEVLEFKLDYLKVPLGGVVSFSNITKFKNYKFLDLFKGVIDTFNLSINTDNVNKVVVIEPTHPYSITNNPNTTNDGYFKDDFIVWDGKEDLSKLWLIQNYADYEREFTLAFKDDTSDGCLKTIQDRVVSKAAVGKYVFPDRFKKGKKTFENSFFSPTVHYEVKQWAEITIETPQMVCIVPENISNTSSSESENTFNPKICYYKGNISGVGGWKTIDEDGTINTYTTFPYMFSVNYKEGGENDPILSYSDEKINNTASGSVIGKGLLKRFFWQRLAIMRNGQFYNTWFRLNFTDVANQLHREFKSYNGQRWQLMQINGYKPLQDGSTACLLHKWHPVEQVDANNTFPSATSVTTGSTPPVNSLDIKYCPLKCLATDIPTA